MKTTNARRRISDEGKVEIARGGAKRTARAAAENITAVKAVQPLIEEEIKANGGVYPHAKTLWVAEISRRAGLSETLLYKSVYDDFRKSLEIWVKKVLGETLAPSSAHPDAEPPRRRSMKQRLQDWKVAYEELKDGNNKTEFDLLFAQDRIVVLERLVVELQGQLAEQSALRVVSMPARTSK